MKLLCSFFLTIPSIALAATQEVPPPRLDPLADRILFLVFLWLIIAVLVVVLRWKISLADTLFRMMPPDKENRRRQGEGNPDPSARSAKDSGEEKKKPRL